MRLLHKLATLAKALARQPKPRQTGTGHPLSDPAPETQAKGVLARSDTGQESSAQEHTLEQVRVADLLQQQADSQDKQS